MSDRDELFFLDRGLRAAMALDLHIWQRYALQISLDVWKLVMQGREW